MMRERTPKTPASNRSIIRNHSPYCESTGPIVQEGFVAARIRALQGFSNQGHILSRSHSPLTPCPPSWPHSHKLRSLPRPSLALKPVLTGADIPSTGTAMRFHTEVLRKDYSDPVDTSGGSVKSSDVAPSFQLQEQKSSPETIMPSRLNLRGRGAADPSPNLFTDASSSPQAQRNQDHAIGSKTQYSPLPEVDQAGDVPMENSSPSEKAILSPHAIQIDLVEPRATWDCLPQTENCSNEDSHEQALKPRASIADKLGSMVERGWMGGDTVDFGYFDDENASYTTEASSLVRDTRLDSRRNSLSQTPCLKTVPSFSRSLSVTTTQMQSESQISSGQDTSSHVKQKDPRIFVYRGLQKRTQVRAKRKLAINTTQRSSSDFGIRYFQTELQSPRRKRRAWTLHRLGRSMSNDGQTQREASSIIRPGHVLDRHSSEQDYESTQSPMSRKGSIPKTGANPPMLGGDQLRQNPVALSKITGPRRASLDTKGSTRPASRSTSFFRRFPWYRVALVDKQPMAQHLSIGGSSSDRTSRSTQAAQHDPACDPIELSRDFSKSHTFDDGRHMENDDASRIKTPPNPDSADHQAMDAIASSCKASWQPCLELMTSSQGIDERQSLEQVQRVAADRQDSSATSSEFKEERPLGNQRRLVKDMFGRAQSLTWTVPAGTQSRIPSQLGSMDANFDSARSGDALQSLRTQCSKVKEHSRLQSYASSCVNSTKLHGDNRSEHGSSGSGTARPDQAFTTSSHSSAHLRSKLVNLSPTDWGTSRDSLPASVDRSDQREPMRRELKGRGKGIKKIQVTVTFDGAEDVVVEATLRKKDQTEHWRTMA